jgi:transposase-like protein
VPEYSDAFKEKMVRKMLPPESVSARALAAETGVGQSTLWRWLHEARSLDVMAKPTKNWTATEKLDAVTKASALSDNDLGEFLRREGLHAAQLKEWRAAAEAGLSDVSTSKRSPEAKRIKELEWELRRKEKALAEAAAILVLQKKARALGLLGDVDDDTTERNER